MGFLGIGKAITGIKLWRKWRWLVPIYTQLETLYRSGELGTILGSRKFRMTLFAQTLGTVVAVTMAMIGLDESTIQMVLVFIGGLFGAGIGSNMYEHRTKMITAIKTAKDAPE